MDIAYSIVVESHTLEEGGDFDRFREVLRRLVAMEAEDGRGEILLADVCGTDDVRALVEREFPSIRRIDATGMNYDRAKDLAVRASRGEAILFCDGDCLPQAGWKDALIDVLDSGEASACGGYTRYDGGALQAWLSVLDFGFMFPLRARAMACFASNNCAFSRRALERFPHPEGYVRCRCYYHAQLMFRHGEPMRLVPEARVLHERQPILRERTRQGYDIIATCWTDPALPKNRLLSLGLLAPPVIYALTTLLDCVRVWRSRDDLGLDALTAAAAIPVFPVLRLLDLAGMTRAMLTEPVRDGWGGWFLASRRAASRVVRGRTAAKARGTLPGAKDERGPR